MTIFCKWFIDGHLISGDEKNPFLDECFRFMYVRITLSPIILECTEGNRRVHIVFIEMNIDLSVTIHRNSLKYLATRNVDRSVDLGLFDGNFSGFCRDVCTFHCNSGSRMICMPSRFEINSSRETFFPTKKMKNRRFIPRTFASTIESRATK